VPSAKGLNVTRKSQTHFTESRTTKAHGDFATAWIDHGREPRGAGYEYVILVRGKDKIEELARAPGKYYRVIQKGAGLHMVASTAGGITGYAFFDPAARPKEGLLKSVDRQCLVMTRGVCQQLRISVCNPDFAWVPQKVAGGFTGAMAQRGKHRESKVVPVQVCLQGCWQVAQPRRTIDVRIVSANDKNTVLAVDCYDAMPIEATLVKAGSAAGLAPQSDHAPDEVRKPDLEKQSELIAVLQSKEATPAQKRTACAGLVNAGTERCVPVLAELLADETMAPSARLVLRNLPYPQADAAFRQALAALSGQGRLAVVESIAVRRDRQAVAPLAELLGSGDPLLVHAALAALGRVGGPESASALTRFQPAAINIRIVWADACLLCADQLYSEGQGAAGSKLYRQVALDNDVPRYVRWEALRRIALTEKSAALPLLMQLATDLDAKTQEESLRIAHVFLPGARATEAIAGRLRWLPPTGQIAILGLLGERGDPAAAPYITTLVSAKGTDKAVRAAASAALAALTH
jgi:HEAT repeat protein